jgi:hypothetical protein
MRVLHIQSDQDVAQLREWLQRGRPVFLLIYMEGCGPCNATRPEWAKMGSALSGRKAEALVADVNKDLLEKLAFANLGSIDGFPTLKYLDGKGGVRAYEDSSVRTKNRSADSFVQWVEGELGGVQKGGARSSAYALFRRLARFRKYSRRRQGTRRRRTERRRRRTGRRRR